MEPKSTARRLEARVYGEVQGVGFRYATVRAATAMGLSGHVRNAHDGSVEVVAEGSPEALERLEAWLRRGPPGAVVRRVDARHAPARGDLGSFTVAY